MASQSRSPRHALRLGVVLALTGLAGAQTTRTYTTTADFAEGAQINVNATVVLDQLQLNVLGQPAPLGLVNIAASGRGTMLRIDVGTGAILGEYATAPNGFPTNPSRTAVDRDGNVWLGNRDESNGLGSVVKIGVCLGGTRSNADGTPNPAGEYLAPPFLYSTCIDRDGDGLLHTSRGLGNVLPWVNVTDGAGGADARVQDADDEAILVFQRTTGLNVRFVGVDASDNLWVGGFPLVPGAFDLLDKTTGGILRTVPALPCGGHGGVIDGQGVLWSSDGDFSTQILRFDTVSANNVHIDHSAQGIGNHGLTVGPDGTIWLTVFDAGAGTPIPKLLKYSPAGILQGAFPMPTGTGLPRSVVVTPIDGDVWVDSSQTRHVVRFTSAGVVRKVIDLGTNGLSPRGLAVDSNGKVWTTCTFSDTAKRINPTGGGDGLGAVDLTVPLGRNARPYNYGEMTGVTPLVVGQPSGTWQVLYDSGVANNEYGTISWHADVPAATSFTVEFRASDNPAALPGLPFVLAQNNVPFSGVFGRFVEIRATFTRPASSTATPVLFDLTILGLGGNGNLDCPTGIRSPASLLLFPEFDNRVGDRTLLTVTNTQAYGTDIKVEFVYIGRVTANGTIVPCLEFNRTHVLTPADTLSVVTNVHNPNHQQGYVYVFAKDKFTGRAIVFDHLIGQALVIQGIGSLSHSFNPYAYLGVGAEGSNTDDDGDGLRDLNNLEYTCAPDVLLFPRFFGQGGGAQGLAYTSDLILINLTGGADFTALVDFLIYNDNEEVFSAQTAFQCWVRRPLLDINGVFAASFLDTTNRSTTEVIGAVGLQTGWFRADGQLATSTAVSLADPAILGLLIETAPFGHQASDLPFETGAQMNGDLLAHGIFGDTTP